MTQIDDNIEYINKLKFIQNSALTNILISNLYNISFVVGDNTETLENVGFDSEWFKWQLASANLSSLSLEYDTQYLYGNRNYTFFKRTDSTFSIIFIETAEFDIRTTMEDWINLINSGAYFDDVNIDEIRFHPISAHMTTGAEESYYKCVPVEVNDIKVDLLTDTVEFPLTEVKFVFETRGVSQAVTSQEITGISSSMRRQLDGTSTR